MNPFDKIKEEFAKYGYSESQKKAFTFTLENVESLELVGNGQVKIVFSFRIKFETLDKDVFKEVAELFYHGKILGYFDEKDDSDALWFSRFDPENEGHTKIFMDGKFTYIRNV